DPWVELDCEDAYLGKEEFSGLGFSEEAPEWFGGKVQFTAKVVIDKADGDHGLGIVLQKPSLAPSHRFRRRWGSANFLTLTFTREVLNTKTQEITSYVKRPFILLGRVFRAYYAKDLQVFLFRTNELVEGSRVHEIRTLTQGISLGQFLNWHNPLEFNRTQTMVKWASRFALGRSSSAPVLRLNIGSIGMIPDICMLRVFFTFHTPLFKLSSNSGSVMTDGAGRINKAAMKVISSTLTLNAWPTAVQCRVQGQSLGLLVLDSTDDSEEPRIWLRPSQMKIEYGECHDPALRTIDLLRSSHTKVQCRLAIETIINLSENGVPSKVFIHLLEETLNRLLDPLLAWEGPLAMERLWCAVANAGGVMTSRLARQDTVMSRVRGYSERGSETTWDNEDEIQEEPQSIAWWSDQVSGCPSTLEETIMALLDSGFSPSTCTILRSKLGSAVKGYIRRYLDSYRIELPPGTSLMAFLVPDELGLLGPGELFFKSSQRDIRTPDGSHTDTLLGEVLITRHPCKLPTDVQKVRNHFYAGVGPLKKLSKWTAVDKLELHRFTDVIVCSTKGSRRAADFLAGGDYDGDKALLIWYPELVHPFTNAPLQFSVEPPSVAECLFSESETVGQFLDRTKECAQQERVEGLQDYLVGSVCDDSVVGCYSNWHLNALYSRGYDDPETIRLAYIFSKVLDGTKNGTKINLERYKADATAFNKRAPHWKEAGSKKVDTSNRIPLVRPDGLPPFVMDELLTHIRTSAWRSNLEQRLTGSFMDGNERDEDLAAPWEEFERQANLQRQEIGTHLQDIQGAASDCEKIMKHVQCIYSKHREQVSRGGTTGLFTRLPIQKRQDILRGFSREFTDGPSDLVSLSQNEAARLKASYAYVYDLEQRQMFDKKWTQCPWDVGFRELCLIKARSSHTTSFKPLSAPFYERFKMSKLPRPGTMSTEC
ncbi:RNA dependent RNA polymerase-domain-containing protein, partial [Mycena vitilis]